MESPIYHLESVVKAKEELEDFTGPLDLILSLLIKNKMEIKDIQLSLILQQYLQWISQRQAMDLEVASEFVAMASHLVDIKTKMLLSIHDAKVTTEMEELIANLEAHRNNESYLRLKKIIPTLLIQYRHGQNVFTKPPEVLERGEDYIYDHKPRELWKAMHNIMTRMDSKKPVELGAFQKIVGREPYPVAQKSMEILSFLQLNGSSPFSDLLTHCQSKSEAVATFISVLELCKNNHLYITMDEDCILHYIDPESPNLPTEQQDPSTPVPQIATPHPEG